MKKAYVILAVFGIWCFTSAIWYMFSVKGVADPDETAIAIAEILIMTLVSVLLGFAIAWYMQQERVNVRQKDVQALLTEREHILKDLNSQRERVKKAEHTLSRARETFHEDYIQVSRERDRMKEEYTNLKSILSDLKDEYSLLQIQLGNEKQKIALLNSTLQEQQQQAALKEKENAGVRYLINPFSVAATIEKNDIDDLKEIKGIGPVIEKKLNMLGIVNFKQISELSDEAVEQIAHTLKFFPDRIRRDHWVEQAKDLAKSSSRKP